MKAVDTLEQCAALLMQLAANGYQIWQMQFDTRAPEGFHAWFWVTGRPEFEIVTHNEAVYNAIINYK